MQRTRPPHQDRGTQGGSKQSLGDRPRSKWWTCELPGLSRAMMWSSEKFREEAKPASTPICFVHSKVYYTTQGPSLPG